MKKEEFTVTSIWWSDEEVFYVEILKDGAYFITTLEFGDFEQSRIELGLEDINFNYMSEDNAIKVATHALKNDPLVNKILNKNLPIIEDTMSLLIQIFYSIKSSPQSCWEYSSTDNDKLIRLYKFSVIANILHETSKKYDFADDLEIDRKKQEIIVYGDFICRFKSRTSINSETIEKLLIEKAKEEIASMA